MRRVPLGRQGVLLAAAVVLLVATIAVDLAYTAPRLREVRRLEAERSRLLGEVGNASLRVQQARDLAEALRVAELRDVLAPPVGGDPVAYVGEVLERWKLTRLELTTSSTQETDRIRKTRFTLSVLGSYDRVFGFLHELENGPRMITVEGIVIESRPGERGLEARFSLTIHDPKVTQ